MHWQQAIYQLWANCFMCWKASFERFVDSNHHWSWQRRGTTQVASYCLNYHLSCCNASMLFRPAMEPISYIHNQLFRTVSIHSVSCAIDYVSPRWRLFERINVVLTEVSQQNNALKIACVSEKMYLYNAMLCWTTMFVSQSLSKSMLTNCQSDP